MVHNRDFERSKITFHNRTFGQFKITANNCNFQQANWTLLQIYRYMYIILDPSKWMAPHCRNGLCPNLCMSAVHLDRDSKLCSSTVILDCPNGWSSKFTLVQRNLGRPNYAIWTQEPIWTDVHSSTDIFFLSPLAKNAKNCKMLKKNYKNHHRVW